MYRANLIYKTELKFGIAVIFTEEAQLQWQKSLQMVYNTFNAGHAIIICASFCDAFVSKRKHECQHCVL